MFEQQLAMTHDIAFLHTANVHIETFQKLVEDANPSIRVRHDVDESLLSEALIEGITESLCMKIDRAMATAAQTGARVVVCTCSTIGGVAENSPQQGLAISVRIDRAMADTAVRTSEKILILAAVKSTLEPTQELLLSSSKRAGKTPTINLQLIDGAWSYFEQGDMEAYYDCIESHINLNHSGFDNVILAQASMAPVAGRFLGNGIRVLASPEIGVKSAIDNIQPV